MQIVRQIVLCAAYLMLGSGGDLRFSLADLRQIRAVQELAAGRGAMLRLLFCNLADKTTHPPASTSPSPPAPNPTNLLPDDTLPPDSLPCLLSFTVDTLFY